MFSLFKKGLEKVSKSFQTVLGKLGDRPTPEALMQLEEVLLQADLGPQVVGEILKELRDERQKGRAPREIVKEILRAKLAGVDKEFPWGAGLQTILIVGVNGAGKTTTVAKLAGLFKRQGRNPMMGSADTFRAAANEQLAMWAQRAGVPLVESKSGGDPAAVAFDALKAAQARGHDTLLIDTAGRLHNKESLMAELQKIDKALGKLDPAAPQHRLLVVDGTLGLNSLMQAKVFHEAVKLSGLIVTKLDGSSKAGALVPIYQALRLPVYWVGLGEGMEDLQPFNLEEYLEGLIEAN